ncbi:hypothetical protein ATANTOWER_029337 [Ataeniobius toweri]|uniref:Uncharacterized protein n=1 Tax=Ataeniobius toweri TaxID=208326 RepID=A0ABU7AKP2_9TELE|nr:hypothetical protein [Ataeniobius toweri]
MHCSPRVTNCSFHNKLQARLPLGGTYEAACDWFCTEITTQEFWTKKGGNEGETKVGKRELKNPPFDPWD